MYDKHMRVTFLILKDYRHAHNMASGPIGLAYLSAAAKARYPDIHVQIEVDPDQVIASNPDIIGISAYTETYSQSIDAARYLRKRYPDKPIWLGGPHINALPTTLDHNFNLGVVGEGEITFVKLLELFEQNKLDAEHLKDVKGIVYWHEGKRHVTAPRETVQDLDSLPIPDRSVLQAYWPPTQQVLKWPQPIYTSRGCPFKCVFCIFSMETQKVRYHSVERVVEEIKDIIKHNPEQKHISINDDLFALSKKRLRELVKGIRDAGLHKKVAFVCMAKASVFSDEMAELMRQMNVAIVTFGLESGVERTLHYLKGPRNKVSENVNAIDICARHGIRMGGYFIIGTPHETYAELQQSYWFIREHFPPMSMAGIYRLTPFPGTKFWQEAIEMGIVSNDLEDWKPFNYLDQDKRDFLFFNSHYSLEDFKTAYAHFAKILDKNHLTLSIEQQEMGMTRHIEPLYADLITRFQPETVLEVSGFTRLDSQEVATDLKIDLTRDLVRPWRVAEDLNLQKQYDLVICNLALETSKTDPETLVKTLEKRVAPGGHLFFVLYNPSHESVVHQSLSGRWNSDFWGTQPFDPTAFVPVNQLKKWLDTHHIEAVNPIRLETQKSVLRPEVLDLLSQIPGANRLAELKHIAYTVLTTPRKKEPAPSWETSSNALPTLPAQKLPT